ncbi:MAG TPA: phosphoserine transaminase, partial [Rhizomicrobium sp.]|nr:phosphoserine transaminase [Rhizomicrobium sp.]
WVTDTIKQLKIKDGRVFKADYGDLPDLSQADPSHDIVFLWNGTTSGVRVPNADWISASREGITICDATSAAFAMDLDWSKLDVTTFSWQKVLGGEAAHGMMVLSPRAVARIESYTPPWPMPKIFRLKKGDKLNEAIFQGETMNTPSMLVVEDYLDALTWAEGIGGLKALQARANANFAALSAWVTKSNWVDFLSRDASYRSNTSVCLKITDPAFTKLDDDARYATVGKIANVLETEGVAFDIAGHRNAPAGLRIWCGATVESAEIEALCPWLDWAWAQVKG